MFYICEEIKQKLGSLYGVMDTSDGVVEYYSARDLSLYINTFGVHISGMNLTPGCLWTFSVIKRDEVEKQKEVVKQFISLCKYAEKLFDYGDLNSNIVMRHRGTNVVKCSLDSLEKEMIVDSDYILSKFAYIDEEISGYLYISWDRETNRYALYGEDFDLETISCFEDRGFPKGVLCPGYRVEGTFEDMLKYINSIK